MNIEQYLQQQSWQGLLLMSDALNSQTLQHNENLNHSLTVSDSAIMLCCTELFHKQFETNRKSHISSLQKIHISSMSNCSLLLLVYLKGKDLSDA